MRILITGGNGQLGQSFAKVAEEYPAHGFFYADLPELDITSQASVAAAISEFRPDVIVNCAAYTAVDRAESEPEAARAINADGARIVAEAASREGIKLVHISTDYVFDGTASRPLREEEPVAPLGVYGRTKLEGEQVVRASGAAAAVVRTAWLYSEFGANFVKTMLRLASERREVNVVDDQRGSPTYAPDLARAVMRVIENGVSGFEIYHFAGSGVTSWCGFAAEIFRLAGSGVKLNPITTAEFPTAAPRPAYSALDTSKIASVGAVVPSWKDSLKICIENIF